MPQNPQDLAKQLGLTVTADDAAKQGLTVEDAKSAVGDISAKVGRVADAAGKGISERMNWSKTP